MWKLFGIIHENDEKPLKRKMIFDIILAVVIKY